MNVTVLVIQILLMAFLWDLQRPIFDQSMKLTLKPLIPFTMLLLLLTMGLAAVR